LATERMNSQAGSGPRWLKGQSVRDDYFASLAEAATDRKPVKGWTHNFYRYPARFSPRFAAAAIECFSRPSDVVLDPYMGGGTAVVEGVVAGRRVIGNDLNSLATFITKVKTTALSDSEIAAIRLWAERSVPQFSYFQDAGELSAFINASKARNLTLARARFIKKVTAAALSSIAVLPTENARDFAKCAVLRVAQWALDGRERHTPLVEFRKRLSSTTENMLASLWSLEQQIRRSRGRATLFNMDSACLDQAPVFRNGKQTVSLVVTSPPYPGVHVLYHRWQVDGRRETPAPYWITGCNDGQGASYYNFGDRREAATETYFRKSLCTLHAIRHVMRRGAHIVQLVAFNRPDDQLRRYLKNMRDAGFAEVEFRDGRIWRQVPHRKWHATLLGKTHSSNEVVLVHRAV